MPSRRDLFIQQLRHERWANARVLTALGAPAVRDTPALGRAIDKLAHNLAARDLWLHRMGGRRAPAPDVFPSGVALDEASGWAERCLDEWDAWLAGLSADDLDQAFTYNSTDGRAWTNTVAETLTHTYTHGFYHRGQIGAIMNGLGVAPPPVDFILFARQTEGDAEPRSLSRPPQRPPGPPGGAASV